jgi:hypothetical protein
MASVLSSHRPVKTRRPPEPVSGFFTWKQRPAPVWSTPGLLIISTITGGNTYRVSAFLDEGRILGFRLEKLGSDEIYDIDVTDPYGPTCTCWDALVREKYATNPAARFCKHIVALGTVLADMGRAA